MKHSAHTPKARGPLVRLGTAAVALLSLGLLVSSPALGSYEQVGTFAGNPGELHPRNYEEWPEEVQLGGVGGMAVNYTGAGGVPAGTVYSATGRGVETYVARYNPDGSFSERWTFTEGPGEPGVIGKERCGPDGEPAHPVCDSYPRRSEASVDVDVDQTTGYVYVFFGDLLTAGKNMLHVYSADGSELIAEFGVKAESTETIASSPEKIHSSFSTGGIAVNASGVVYVFDESNPVSRLIVFKPQSPGDHEHYVYAGQGSDIVVENIRPRMPVADAAGDLYVLSGASDSIVKLDPDQPAGPPLCVFKFSKGHIHVITVEPQSGEVFFNTDTDKKIHQLSPCEAGAGFKEVGSFVFEPTRFALTAMAYDPGRQFDPSRPTGTLYAAAPGNEGGKSEGEYPNDKIESSMGYVFAQPAEFPPVVEAQSVAHVTATTAELSAQINPKGPPTDYVFQYETQAEYEANEPADRFTGAKEAPPGGGFLGEGPKALSAAAALTGLHADTTYYYRAVATTHCSVALPEKICEGTGADQSFHTFPAESSGLPDERVYELVSPAIKGSGQVFPSDPGISSCGPETICKPGDQLPRYPLQSSPSGDAVVYEGQPFSDEGAPQANEYVARRDRTAGWKTTTLSLTQMSDGDGYREFSPSLGEGIYLQSIPALSPEAPADYENLYAQPTDDPLALSPMLLSAPPNRPPGLISNQFKVTYGGASSDLSRVFFAANDALTFETPFAPEAVDGGASKFNLYEWEKATGELHLVNVLPDNATSEVGASFGPYSANAISDDGSRAFWSSISGQVYVRENAESTEAIPDSGKFLAAATDGSKVLLTNGHLYDLEEEATTDLTDGKGGFQGLSGQSEDLSHVYFVDTEVLSGEEENSEGDKAQAGKFNLYAWEAGGSARYVATLVEKDGKGSSIAHTTTWSSLPSSRTAEASLHGRYLGFSSQARLTGYDNTGPCETDHAGHFTTSACPEAFLYDSATSELTCVSCNPTGERPLGHATIRLIRAGTNFLPQPRYLTDEGRLYFDSRDSLSVNDTNDGVEDVYQYEPNGIGTCKRDTGCVNLISAGREPIDSNLLTIDEDGGSVFFTTRDQLVLKDHDDLIDLYVAREKGGIPAETEVARSECQGEACVAAYSPPNDPTPGSSSFEGAGNVDEKKTTKKHAKKHKKKHAKKGHKRSRANHNRGGAK